jgi:hypothetical protein
MGGSSGGQAGSANLLFFDDFEDGVADGWVEGGSSARDWHVLAGIYVQSRPYNAHSIAGNPAWTDQVVEVDVIRRDMGTLGIFVRYQAMDTHYRLLAGGNGALNLTREVAGVTTSLARAGVGFPDRFRLKCSAIGTTLRAYVDDVPYLTVSDSAVSSGSIGVMPTSEGSFDNVRVTSQ